MIYKIYDIKTDWQWMINPDPLSRYIIFEAKGDKNAIFVFNNNMLNHMAENAGGVDLDDNKLQVLAREEIKKCIDREKDLGEKFYYFELFSQSFIRDAMPEWCRGLFFQKG